VPNHVGVVVSARLATLTELDTTLGCEDLYDLLEIVLIDAHNQRIASKPTKSTGN
jgi:hypothetical protein